MEFFDIIKKRRSIRKYKSKHIVWDDVAKILQAGKAAPVAGNIFNMRFIVVKSQAARSQIAEACMEQMWMQDAPIHIAIVADNEKLERYYGVRGALQYTLHNSGAAATNMILAATRLGLGTCWVEAFDEDKLDNIFGLLPGISVQCILTVGYAAERPISPPKKMLEEVVFFEKWGGRIEGPKTGISEYQPRVEKATGLAEEAIKREGPRLVEKVRKHLNKLRGKKK